VKPDEGPFDEKNRAATMARIANIIDRHFDPYDANRKRILVLITIAETYQEGVPEILPTHREDLLRAAVVFLHATVEELLRGLATAYLPLVGEDVLNRIPLAGSVDSLRPEKFLLGRLSKYRDKTVDQLIEDSIDEHVARRTFSNTNEIASLFEQLGFEIDESLKEIFSRLSALIERRHQIVHRADVASGERKPTPLSPATVRDWVVAVRNFFSYISAMDVCRAIPSLVRSAPAKGSKSSEPRIDT
jgi:hypothetical protein